MENYKDVIQEHEGGTEIPLNSHAQLLEKYESLQVDHLKALEENRNEDAEKIEEEMNFISEKLGLEELEEPKLAA